MVSNKSFGVLIALFIFICFFPVKTLAADFYVASNGSDNNSGTLNSPFLTITKGINTMNLGDTVYVRAGVYPSFTISRSGSTNGYLTISAYNNEVPKIQGGIGIRLNNVSYVKIKGFEVTGAGGAGVLRKGGIVITNGSNNYIENNLVHHNNVDSPNGIKIEGSSFNHILNNVVHNNGGVDGGLGIRIIGYFPSPASLNNEIGGNTVYANTAAGSNADGIGLIDNVGSTNIHDNIVYGNGDDGIDTWTSQGNLITNNRSYNHIGPGDGNGFKLGGFDGTRSGGNNIIQNNVAYGNKYNGFDSNGSGGNYFESNVAYDNGHISSSINAWGFIDDARSNNDTRLSTFINNNSYNNKTANYGVGQYVATFTGNTELPPGTFNASDLEPDGDVDVADYNILVSNFGLRGALGWIRSDILRNGVVDIFDFNKLIIDFGQ